MSWDGCFSVSLNFSTGYNSQIQNKAGSKFFIRPQEESEVFWIADRRVLHVRQIWWWVRRWNFTQVFHCWMTLKKVDLDAGLSSFDLAYAWYIKYMFIQLPCGSSFIGNLLGSWLQLIWIVGPVRRESTNLSKSSCRRSWSALLRTVLEAILERKIAQKMSQYVTIMQDDSKRVFNINGAKGRIIQNTSVGLLGTLDFRWLSHSVGIGSAAVKYMWIIKEWTEALLTAGAAPGPKMAAL
jgi:hypothetical protein